MWSRRFHPTFVVVLLVVSLAGPASAEPTESLQNAGQATVGRQVPWFSGWDTGNRVVNLTGLLQEGHAGCLMILFATYCKPCEEGLRRLVGELPRLRDRGVKVILLDYREDAETVIPWLKKKGFPFDTVLLDPFGRLALTFGALEMVGREEKVSLPRSLVWDRAGIVRGIFGKEGEDYLARVLSLVPGP
jgi:peroxiredoxin